MTKNQKLEALKAQAEAWEAGFTTGINFVYNKKWCLENLPWTKEQAAKLREEWEKKWDKQIKEFISEQKEKILTGQIYGGQK